MSNEALNWAFRQEASTVSAKFVLVALADAANDDHACFLSQATLAAMTQQGERTVRRAVFDLESAGQVKRERRFDNGGHRMSDRFILPVGTARSLPATVAEPTGQSGQAYRPETTNLPATVAEPTGQSGQVTQREPSKTIKPSEPCRPDVDRICEHLADRIERNGSNRPTIGNRWRTSARLLIDVDKRTEQQIHNAIDWCQDHEFWRGNILSIPKLRQQYDQLRLAALRPAPGTPTRAKPQPLPGSTSVRYQASTEW